MVDLNKVSKAVQQFVSDIAKTEGNKKQIDTKAEYNKLGDYLANNENMNVHEQKFIKGFMIEYENKEKAEAEKAFENAVTDSTKKAVKNIAKRMENKKYIDTDDEAQALLNMLRNSKGDLNKADLEYIKRALIDAGYGKLLENTNKGISGENTNAGSEKEPINNAETKDPDKSQNSQEPVKPDIPQEPSKPTEPAIPNKPDKPQEPEKPTKPTKPYKPQKPSKPTEPAIPDEPDVPTPPSEIKKPTITERGRTDGIGLAQKLAHELDSFSSDNRSIRHILQQVNSENAYSFFKSFQSTTGSQVNQEVFSVSDLFNKIGYKDTAKAMKALLSQAKSFGLENSQAYKELQNNINFIDQRVAGNNNVDPMGREAYNSDRAINNLVKLMGQAMV